MFYQITPEIGIGLAGLTFTIITCIGCRYNNQDGEIDDHCENPFANLHKHYPESYNCNGYDKPTVIQAQAFDDIEP